MKGYHEYKDIIELCLRCAAICQHCASSCTKEEDVKMMADCIQLDMECETLCIATAKLLSLGSRHGAALAAICADACDACAKECEQHDNKHCRECAAICKECAAACRRLKESQ